MQKKIFTFRIFGENCSQWAKRKTEEPAALFCFILEKIRSHLYSTRYALFGVKIRPTRRPTCRTFLNILSRSTFFRANCSLRYRIYIFHTLYFYMGFVMLLKYDRSIFSRATWQAMHFPSRSFRNRNFGNIPLFKVPLIYKFIQFYWRNNHISWLLLEIKQFTKKNFYYVFPLRKSHCRKNCARGDVSRTRVHRVHTEPLAGAASVRVGVDHPLLQDPRLRGTTALHVGQRRDGRLLQARAERWRRAMHNSDWLCENGNANFAQPCALRW